jgi:hypothetical protein
VTQAALRREHECLADFSQRNALWSFA